MPIYFNLTHHHLPIGIESIGDHWPQTTVERLHGYPYYHWLQSTQGEGEIWLDNQQIILRSGTGILIPPFMPHRYFPLSSDWETCFVTFNGELQPYLMHLVGSAHYLVIEDSPAFLPLIQQMIDHIQQDTNSLDLSLLCYQFPLYLHQSQSPWHQHPLYQQYIEPCLSLIQQHYQTDLTIEQLAHQVFITPQYLTKLFKQFIGQSPYQYLLAYRIQHAKQLLINRPELSIQQIAARIGFNSTSQFIQLFKQKVGLTPKKFRHHY